MVCTTSSRTNGQSTLDCFISQGYNKCGRCFSLPAAGHTPYSLAGTDASKGCIQEYDEGKEADLAYRGVRMFNSVMTETGAEQTPAATLKTCPQTPLSIEESAQSTPAAIAAGMSDAGPGKATANRTAGGSDMALQTPGSPAAQASTRDTSFSGFFASAVGSEPNSSSEGTPVLIRKPADAVAVSKTQQAPGADAQPSLSTATPRSKLKQPARVPVSSTR